LNEKGLGLIKFYKSINLLLFLRRKPREEAFGTHCFSILPFMLALAGCGTSQSEGTSGGGKEMKTLKVATDAAYAPFESLENGKIVGFDVDLVNAAAKEAGYKANVVNVGWDPLFVEIKEKKSDLAVSAITITDDRKQTYDFSVPYYLSTNEILVPENSTISSGADLKGKTVAVQNATTGQEVAESILGKNSPHELIS